MTFDGFLNKNLLYKNSKDEKSNWTKLMKVIFTEDQGNLKDYFRYLSTKIKNQVTRVNFIT
jgi:hypothetical protein